MANEMEERILEHATKKFMQFGVRTVTMDDIARELGISKKTIYQAFETKADLVYAISELHFEEEKRAFDEIEASSKNAVDGLVKVARWSFEMFRHMSPNLVIEMQKYYPKAWGVFLDFRIDYILQKIRENLIRGIQEGFYRKDLQVEIVARLRLSQIDSSIREEYFPVREFPPVDVQMEMFELFVRGIVSDAGQQLLDTYLNQSSTHWKQTSAS